MPSQHPFTGAIRSVSSIAAWLRTPSDWTAGEVLNRLDEYGMADDTTAVFASGHDLPARFARFPEPAHPSVYRMRRGTRRSPTAGKGPPGPQIVRLPGRLSRGGVIDEIVCLTDLLQAPAMVAGITVGTESDDIGILGILAGSKTAGERCGGAFPERRLVRHPSWPLQRPSSRAGSAASRTWSALPSPGRRERAALRRRGGPVRAAQSLG